MTPQKTSAEGIVRRVPWKAAVAVALLLAIGVLGYLAMELRREDRLRRNLLAQQEALAQQGGEHLASLRQRIAALVGAETGAYLGDLRAPGFDPQQYRDLPGVYLRLPLEIAAQPKTMDEMAQRQPKDALAGCLGLAPPRYGQVLREGAVFTPEYRQRILDAPNMTRLQVLAEDFRIRVERDLQPLATHLRPAYLLLVLEEKPEADLQRFRIAFFDLQQGDGQVVARGRTESAHRLLPVRWLPRPDRRPLEPEPDPQAENTAADCAIAAAFKPVGSVETMPTAGATEGPGAAAAVGAAAVGAAVEPAPNPVPPPAPGAQEGR